MLINRSKMYLVPVWFGFMKIKGALLNPIFYEPKKHVIEPKIENACLVKILKTALLDPVFYEPKKCITEPKIEKACLVKILKTVLLGWKCRTLGLMWQPFSCNCKLQRT